MSFKRSVYNIIPFKKQLFGLFRSLFGVPKFFEALRFSGRFKIPVKEYDTSFYLHNAMDLHRETDLFWRGIFTAYESVSLKSWAAISKEGKVVLDVGANTGIFSILAKAVNPDAKVIAFEPIPYNIEILKKNVSTNQFDIDVVEKAISNEDGECTMFVKPETVNYMTSVNLNRETDKESIEMTIPTVSIDSYLESQGIDHIDIIKLDVEGHEFEALQGAAGIIEKCLPTILVEVLSDEDGEKMKMFFSSFPYVFFKIDENYEKVQATPVDTLTNNHGQNYLVCSQEVADSLKNAKII